MDSSEAELVKIIVNKRILIVDDEIFNIEALKMILSFVFDIHHIESVCEIALNGEEAV